jgi:hypothetical protein
MKYFKLLLLWALLIYANNSTAQTNLTTVEFFIDTDPGYGNGTTIFVPAGTTNYANQIVNIDPATVSEGIHTFYIRSKNADGSWSHTNRLLFNKPANNGATAIAANLITVEYFIDVDPGYGNGTTILVPAGTTDYANQIVNINPATVSDGIHTFYIRSKNADGSWSHTNRLLFNKPENNGAAAVAANLTTVEYFIDVDPGYGNGTTITVPAGTTDYANQIINLDPSTINDGVHVFYIRSKNANGTWSHTNKLFFYKAPTPSVNDRITNIKYAEYFFDTDPGYYLASPIAITPSIDISNFLLNTNITGLAAGNHKFFIRGIDSIGKWSHTDSLAFSIGTTSPAPAIVVNSINKLVMCARDSFTIAYQATGTYNAGNTFTVQLSDAAGSFVSPTIIGTKTATKLSDTILCRLPAHINGGTGFLIRVVSSNTAVTGIANSQVFTIRDRPFAQTISGLTEVNGTYTHPYSVPDVATSNYNWITTGGTFTTGIPASSGNMAWAQPAGTNATGLLKVVETNQFGCVGDTSALSVNVYRLRINNVPDNLTPCKAFSLNIPITMDGAFGAGNIYTAQLSDATGSFTSPVTIGTLTSNGNGINQTGTISATIPANTPNGTLYRIRIVSNNPAFIGSINSAPITIVKPDIGADLVRSKCIGFTYNLAADFTDASLTYQYFDNSFNVVNANVNSGTFNVIATNTNGCKDTAQVVVTNFPKPNIGADITRSKCQANTYNLAIDFTNVALTYQYFDNNFVITNANVNVGVYNVVGANSNGCKDTAQVTVTNFVQPNTSAISSANTVNVDFANAFSVTNTTGSIYNWSFTNGTQNTGGTTSSVTATFNTAGTQTVSVTETTSDGCVGSVISKSINVVSISAENIPMGFPACTGANVSVNYTINGNYGTGNIFSVLLSDAAGNFASASVIGTLQLDGLLNNATGFINCAIPTSISAGTGYRTKITASMPVFSGAINSTNLTITTANNTFNLSSDITVNGNLDLSNPSQINFPCFSGGKIILGNFNLRVNGAVTGFDDTHFIVTNGSGSLCINNAASQNNVFPIANNVNSTNFIRINNVGTPDVYCVNVTAQVLVNGTSGNTVNSSVVKNTWNVSEAVTGGSDATLSVFWNVTDELPNFNRSSCYISHHNGVFYDVQPSSMATGSNPYSISRQNISSFSPFIVTSSASVLPISLLGFTGKIQNNVSLLKWQTTQEQNSKNFIVQRSEDGIRFTNIGSVDAANNSNTLRNYAYDDDISSIRAAKIYYRLLLNDNNGQQELSNIIVLYNSNNKDEFVVSPNPFQHTFLIKGVFDKIENATFCILDLTGKELLIKKVITQLGINVFEIDASQFARGSYILRVRTQSKELSKMIIKK